MAELLILFSAAALCVIAALAILNTLTFPRLRPTGHPPAGERVSVLIPARNEAAVIGETVRALLAQTHANLELILLDDGSTDGTAEVARAAAAGDPRLRILTGKPLPEGWFGKNWACAQLAEAATSDVLLFTDADVHWSDEGVAAVLTLLDQSGAGLLSVWPTQTTVTWGERLVVPLMAFVILGYLPWPLVAYTRFAVFAAANGQCMAFRRVAYEAVGGHNAVRASIIEDIALARRVKRAGLRLWLADGAGLVCCRMYRNWPEVRNGYAKNILAGYGNSLVFLALATLFHWLILLFPWAWLAAGLVGPVAGPYPLGPLLLIALGVLIRALTAVATRQRLRDAPLLPVSALLMTVIAGQAVYWRLRYGGPRWKGRTLKAE
jgi:chlorobactene glucosyltransferase